MLAQRFFGRRCPHVAVDSWAKMVLSRNGNGRFRLFGVGLRNPLRFSSKNLSCSPILWGGRVQRHGRSVASTLSNFSFPSSGFLLPFSAQPSAAFASNASSIRSLVLWPTAQGRTPYILRGTKQPCGNERRGKWHRRAKEETGFDCLV